MANVTSYTFVTHKGARPEKSELVKSHVMRESQRRRREAKKRRDSMCESVVPGCRGLTCADAALSDARSSSVGGTPQRATRNQEISIQLHEDSYGGIASERLSALTSYPTFFPSTSLSPQSSSHSSWKDDPEATDKTVSWAGSQDVIISDALVKEVQSWPPDLACYSEMETNFYAFFGRTRCKSSYSLAEPDRLPAPNLTRQPPLAAFEDEDGVCGSAYLSRLLYSRVADLVSHCTMPQIPA
ncbi:hypothetical protein BS50DRAFT_19395 [Corynespora cassiicola Philippines]|uniref:Uncharacterized protein n=1 Tax=Corynespora cassiicola Philippines TaxID=1448308 RepID=A0A2T2PA98_CORCC|nr:hypothetical protein BS50DRAFT_19395 [Corynespora cassiicola Philippines]